MKIKTGRKYEQNKKIIEDVKKNQVDYRESEDEPIKFIKRVSIYITDKKGNILKDVKITFDDHEIITGKYGLLISQFPNKETDITAEKEGYKTATAKMILDAKIQTHEFFLALEESDEESEVISTDNTVDDIENQGYSYDNIIFQPPLDGTDEITSWAGTNKTYDGIFDVHGGILSDGWSNEGLWQLEYDVAYSGKNTVMNGYVGVLTMCVEKIQNYSVGMEGKKALETWEGQASPHGLNAKIIGPTQYAYTNRREYHHAILRKTSDTTLEFEFDGNTWFYTIDNLSDFGTLYIGARNNPASPGSGENIYLKNIIVYRLDKESSESGNEIEGPQIEPPEPFVEEEGEW